LCAENGREALNILDKDAGQTIKLIIMDLNMPVMDGIETLKIIQQKHPAIPVIMLTGSQEITDAVQCMKYGAIDFLSKPYEADRMAITVKNALKISTLTKEVSRLKQEKTGTLSFENLIGYDGGLQSVIFIARKAAASDIPILITGETGTGKEVFSKAIHGESARTGKPFIAVNCGAIPAQLVESTLFGHEKGAFTGATEKTVGKFREAEGGTIFLDEVGELPLDAQVKLLRVLQQKEVEPVGAAKPIPINVRIISATNRNLEQEIAAGNFREDLFFRLNVLNIKLPALRDRKEDIPSLAYHFVERFCSQEGGIPKEITQDTLNDLMQFDWPGNIRQLENVINRAMVISDGNVLNMDSNLTSLTNNQNKAVRPQTASNNALDIITHDGVFKTMDAIEQAAMAIALEHFDHNITQAAKALGMAKSTFYKKMKKQSDQG
ncbi:MAG: sigma-54-dependent Fis family transcriptional regulator, partial [Micavibrio sp.]|nr:sigma-54-dependent Fis family transcriptional regulator [Micavibrio sp.]